MIHHMCETWSQHTWWLCSRPGFGPLKPGCDNRWSFVFLWHRTVWCRTGQALFTVRCALATALTSARIVLHCSRSLRLLQSTVAWRSRCFAGALDSLMAHRTVWWIIAEHAQRNPKVASLELYGPGAPDSLVRQTRAPLVPLLLWFWTLTLFFYWFVLNLYAPVEYII
jgi:hypothetical protein